MAFIPPIVSPLLQMVKDLAAALNETRGYLGLPPIDADALIAKAYGEAPATPVVPPVAKPVEVVESKPEVKPEPKPEVKPEPVKEEAAACTPDGKYAVSMVSLGGGHKPGFDPKNFCSNGIFLLEIAGGKATFTVKTNLSDAEREDWDTLGCPEVCDGSYQPYLGYPPVTDSPGTAEFKNGIWEVIVPVELS